MSEAPKRLTLADLPSYIQPIDVFSAWVDLTDLGYGRVRITDRPKALINRLASLQKKEGADSAKVQAQLALAYVDEVDAPPGKFPSVRAPIDINEWTGWYGSTPSKVVSRLQDAVSLYILGDPDLGNAFETASASCSLAETGATLGTTTSG